MIIPRANPILANDISSSLIDDEILLLDFFTEASAAYSLRRLKTTALKAIKVRRSSDDAELDIGFCGVKLDIGTLISFVGSNSGFISMWYDQSGKGNDAAQSNTSKQPRIINSGVLDVDSSNLPTLTFNGSSHKLSLSNTSLLRNLNGALLNAVAKDTSPTTGGAAHAILCATNQAGTAGRVLLSTRVAGSNVFGSGGRRLDSDSFVSSTNSSSNSNFNIHSGSFDYSINGKVTYYINASGQTATSFSSGAGSSHDLESGEISIGDYANANYFGGNISEIIVFNSLVSNSKRKNIETNQSRYYSISL